jgi:hypothetical protein
MKKKLYFIIKYHSSLDNHIEYDTPKYWSDSSYGWIESPQEATRFLEDKADKILLHLLKEHRVVAELIDITKPANSKFHINTVFVDSYGVPYTVTACPNFSGDRYILSYFDANDSKINHKCWMEEDLVDDLRNQDLEVIWDSQQKRVPETNEDFLADYK